MGPVHKLHQCHLSQNPHQALALLNRMRWGLRLVKGRYQLTQTAHILQPVDLKHVNFPR